MLPLIVVEDDDELAAAERELRGRGWAVSRGFRLVGTEWSVDRCRSVCAGKIEAALDAEEALLAAARGAGLLVKVRPRTPLTAAFVDDLRRLGTIEYRRMNDPHRLQLTEGQVQVLELVAEGRRVADVARQLHVSPRTIDRRLAHARELLGVRTTAEAVALSRRSSAH